MRLMSLSGFLVFAGVYFLAVASPGPGLMSLIARTVSRGLAGMPAYIAGFVVGDLVLYTLAAMGLAVLAKTYAPIFEIIRYGGALYLFYLAYRLWTQTDMLKFETARIPEISHLRAFMGSLILTLGNPKPILFFLSIMPLVVDPSTFSPVLFLELAVVIVLVLTGVMSMTALLADRTRRLLTSSRAVQRLHKGTGALMAAAGIMILTRE